MPLGTGSKSGVWLQREGFIISSLRRYGARDLRHCGAISVGTKQIESASALSDTVPYTLTILS